MKTIRFASLLLLMSLVAWSQTALTSTTFSAAVAVTDEYVSVASATGITARSGGTVTTMLYSGREAFRVISVSSTLIRVERGSSGSRWHAHASGNTVYVGAPGYFTFSAPPVGGTCTGAQQGYSPLIVIQTGEHFECVASLWKAVELDEDPVVSVNVGAAGTNVVAVEKGDGRRHFTTLTLTDTAIGTTVATANEAYGALIYTFPAGIVVVNSASISVGLTATTATCDADIPDSGLGTVIASGAVATLDGTGTFEDILTGVAADNMTGTAELSTVHQGMAIELAGAHTVHYNIADGMAGASCVITADGTVYLDWTLLN